MHHHTTTLLIATLLITPGVVFGQDSFVPLVGIPYIDGGEVQSIGDYVNAFYFAAISIAAFLAVVRIIFAGVKYMLSDIVTTKQVAKKDIRTALLGLLIVVGAVLILRTINSELTEIQLFPDDAPVPQITGGSGELYGGGSDTLTTSGLNTEINVCEYTRRAVDAFRTACPGYINTVTVQGSRCPIMRCEQSIVYDGPENCPVGFVQRIEGTTRVCIEDEEPAPTVPGETVSTAVVEFPCANQFRCQYANDSGWLGGIATAEAQCAELAGSTYFEFRVTGMGVGTCYYVAP